MNQQKDILEMLQLLSKPAFCAIDGRIVKVNSAAEALPLRPDMEVKQLLATGKEEYSAFTGGCLYLTLFLEPRTWGASVIRMEQMDIFLLDARAEEPQLQAMALAARELRRPLSNMMIAASRLPSTDDPEEQKHSAMLNRGIHQMLRLLGNMSDAGRLPGSARLEMRNISEIFNEIMEKARAQLSQVQVTVSYRPVEEAVYGPVDQGLLERAVLNILSNAVKFTPTDGHICVQAARLGNMFRFRIEDDGAGIASDQLGTVFVRYLRDPGIEDSRLGLGLGMRIVRAAASSHGGTVLIDPSPSGGTRVTMTIALPRSSGSILRSPVVLPDYTGGWDHGLVELSDCLPLSAYYPQL